MITRLYDRYGPMGLLVVGIAGTAIAAVISGIAIFLAGSRVIGTSFGEQLPWLLAGEGLMLASLAAGLLASRALLRSLVTWPSSDRSAARSADVWATAVNAPGRLTWRVYLAILVWLPLYGWFWLAAFDQPAWVFVPWFIVFLLLLAAGGSFVMLSLDFLWRPLMKDVAAHLPSGFQPSTPALSVRAKALIPVPGTVILVLILTGPFIMDFPQDYATRITVGAGLSIFAALVASAIFLLLTHASLDPIDELTAATKRVQDGDLSSPVPILSADELGTLAASFNRMLDHMRRHESALRESRARIVATADEERRRVERDLHDGAQQRLVLINLKTEMLSRYVTPEGKALLNELQSDARQAVDELRDLAHGIYPPLLESDGLAAALEDVADQSAVPVTVDSDGTGRYASQVEAAVYFCCLEALQNAAKHAGNGSHVRIELAEHDGTLHFSVADDGRGFDATTVNGSGGVQNMTDRIGALGGTVQIRSSPGHGTVVTGVVPLVAEGDR